MRVKRLTTWLVLGLAVALAYAERRRRGAPQRRAVPVGSRGTPANIDGSTLGRPDEAGELFVEAISEWDLEPEGELDVAVTEPTPFSPHGTRLDPNAYPDPYADDPSLGEPSRADVYGDRRAARGSGDLYGVHVTPAVDRDLPDDDQAQAEGENWLEHLGASSAELGPEPEHELDVVDDSDQFAGHHKTATSDTPVADLGSGGPRGL